LRADGPARPALGDPRDVAGSGRSRGRQPPAAARPPGHAATDSESASITDTTETDAEQSAMRHPRLRELVLLCFVGGIFVMGFIQLGNVVALPFLSFVCVFAAIHLGVRVLAPRADPILVPITALLVAVGSIELAAIDRT